MLADSFNPELYYDWLTHILAPETKDAFIFIVGYAACLSEYKCHPQFKGKNGPLRDFRFFNSRNEQVFAFIVNQQWLLFYFRAPAVRSNRYSFETIKSTFSSALTNNGGEWTIKIKSIADAKALTNMLCLK
jgi:hypothetical protein